MRKWIAIILICCLFLTGCKPWNTLKSIMHFGEVEEFDYGVSALQWLPEIQEKAKIWRADAYLFAVSESEIDANGNSNKWVYLFYSPGSGKSILYTYDSGFISQRETVLSPLNPIAGLKVDTPTALYRASEAAKNFVDSATVNTRIISLIGPAYDSRQTVTKWQVVFYNDTGSHQVMINAATGAVIK